MKARITTTITTYVDIASMTPEHEVSVETDDELPQQVVIAAALGGCKTAVKTLEGM